jgi:PAS domain S-box-containing protein
MGLAGAGVPLERETFQEVADQAPVILWRINADFSCDWVNKAWLDYTGGTLEEETGFAWLDRLHPADLERTAERFDLAFSARKPAAVEFRLRRHDGVYRWFLDSGVPFYRGAVFAGFVGSCVDITDRHLAESRVEALRLGLSEVLRRSG